jgi:hypothetical protein
MGTALLRSSENGVWGREGVYERLRKAKGDGCKYSSSILKFELRN